MLVTDYDIIVATDVNGYPLELQRADHMTVVWEPKKLLVPVTATTIPSSGVYVLYDPTDLIAIGPSFSLEEQIVGPQGTGVQGVTTMLDKFALWQFDSGKLKMIGTNLYLNTEGQTATPDVNRTAVVDATGVTVTLDNSGTGAGGVYPVITLPTGTFRLGLTITGPDGYGHYSYFGPNWYNQSQSCLPDAHLILYKVEDVQA